MKTRTDRLLRVSSQQLRCFEATARLLSVTRAAQELHVTQPTVSVQLRDLADAIGEPLLETTGRRVRLTQAGEALRDTVGELRDCWHRFDARLGEIHGLMRGRLRIAAVTTAEYFVPDLLGPFAAAHPGVEVELAVENRDRVVERLERGLDDLAVMMLPPEQLPLHSVPFLENPLLVVAAARHPAVGRRVRLSSLADQRWLLREPGSGTRLVAEAHFAAAGIQPRVAMSLGSNEAIKHAVAAGLGIAVLSQLAVQAELDAKRLAALAVSGFPIRRRWHLVWRSDRPQTLAARRLVDDLRQPAARRSLSPAPGRRAAR
ncbi:MAG TPA: LysR family transcriptional regulator [Ramlibacter sp.]|nr:LysR family transcriptional regulator [Ramlibacter sp.]